MKVSNIISDKSKSFLCALVCVFIMISQSFSVAFAKEYKIPKDMKVGENLIIYGHANVGSGINLGALNNPENNLILAAALNEITFESLKELRIPNLQQRLIQLERGSLIKNVENRYQLAFPTVVGQKRAKLQEYVKQVAKQLLPIGENMIFF